jgi:hypothetical protein
MHREQDPGAVAPSGATALAFGANALSQRSDKISTGPLPAPAVEALRTRKARQNADRHEAGQLWTDNDLVFTTTVGTDLDAHNAARVPQAHQGRWP